MLPFKNGLIPRPQVQVIRCTTGYAPAALGAAAVYYGGKWLVNKAVKNVVSHALGITDGSGLYRGRGGFMEDRVVPIVNSLVTMGQKNEDDIVPMFHPTDVSEVMYSNREYISDVYAPSSSAFSLQRFAINPGLQNCFPWLAQLAINFEEYELYQLAFTFKTTVSDFAVNNGQVGSVYMATQMNPSSDTFANKEEMMLYAGSGSSKVTVHQIQGVECDPSKIAGSPQKYVRAGNLPASEDLKQYDLGVFNLAIENVPAAFFNQQVGELWVSYTVKLRKPKLASGNAYNVHRDIFMSDNQVQPFLFGNHVGTGLIQGSRNVLGITVVGPKTTSETCVTSGFTSLNCDNFASESTIAITDTYLNCGVFTFPDTFAGICEIKMVLTSQSTFPTPLLDWQLAAQGNISRFRDLPSSTAHTQASQAWSHYSATQGDLRTVAVPSLNQCFVLIMHIRVNKATNGVKNRVQFSTGLPANQPGGPPVVAYQYNQCYAEFTGYNSFLSVQDNGTNDALALQNSAGVGVQYP